MGILPAAFECTGVGMNALKDNFLRVELDDGTRRDIGVTDICGTKDGRVPVRLCADNWVLREGSRLFLTAVLQVLMAPADEADFEKMWQVPPDRGQLETALAEFSRWFELSGEAPLFQDRTLAALDGCKITGVEELIPYGTGSSTRLKNANLWNPECQAIGARNIVPVLTLIL